MSRPVSGPKTAAKQPLPTAPASTIPKSAKPAPKHSAKPGLLMFYDKNSFPRRIKNRFQI